MWSEVMQVGFLWPKLLISVISQARVEPTSSPLAYIDAQNTKIRFCSYFFLPFCYAHSDIDVFDWSGKKPQLKLDFPINECVQGYDVQQRLLKEKANTKRRRYCIYPYFNSLSFSSPFNNIRSKKITINYSLAWTAALNAEASWDPESTFPGSRRLPASPGDFKRSIYYLLVVTTKGSAALADLPRKHPAELVWSKGSVWERRPDRRSCL